MWVDKVIPSENILDSFYVSFMPNSVHYAFSMSILNASFIGLNSTEVAGDLLWERLLLETNYMWSGFIGISRCLH